MSFWYVAVRFRQYLEPEAVAGRRNDGHGRWSRHCPLAGGESLRFWWTLLGVAVCHHSGLGRLKPVGPVRARCLGRWLLRVGPPLPWHPEETSEKMCVPCFLKQHLGLTNGAAILHEVRHGKAKKENRLRAFCSNLVG